MSPQRIINLDAAVPEAITVVIDGENYELPGDIPIPDFIEIERLMKQLGDPETAGAETLEALYDCVLGIFQVKQPDIEELPIGPQRLGSLVFQLYAGAADEDEGKAEAAPARPTRGTTSTSKRKKRQTRSRGSKS